MALDGLVSRNTGGYVKSFWLLGQWKECGIEDFEKGRVPDNTMMLNIVIKAALDKMDRLEEFRSDVHADSSCIANSAQVGTQFQTITDYISRSWVAIHSPISHHPIFVESNTASYSADAWHTYASVPPPNGH
jgi:hypothetical protein